MLEGLYSAASGLAAQQTRLDAVANDLANANTTGYKPVRVAYRDLAYDLPATGGTGRASNGAGAAAAFMGRDDRQGPLQPTERKLDVALDGPGYLRVRRADGNEALTRSGALQLDSAGRLTTADGDLLQPAITVPAGVRGEDLDIASTGAVSANGRPIGQLAVADVPNPGGLVSLGGSLFSPSAASGAVRPVAAGTTSVVQGSLEASGVEISAAMTDMMDAQRAFQLASKAISTRDEVWGIANGIKR